jgi:hypothetical protein
MNWAERVEQKDQEDQKGEDWLSDPHPSDLLILL